MINRKEALFLLKFFAIVTFFQLLLLVFEPLVLEESLAGLEAGFVGLESNSNSILLNEGAFVISANCTGLLSAGTFIAIVFALRKPGLKNKLVISAAGIITILLVNLVRLYTVILTGKVFGLGLADLAHVASWFAMFFAILIVWYYFTKKSGQEIKEML